MYVNFRANMQNELQMTEDGKSVVKKDALALKTAENDVVTFPDDFGDQYYEFTDAEIVLWSQQPDRKILQLLQDRKLTLDRLAELLGNNISRAAKIYREYCQEKSKRTMRSSRSKSTILRLTEHLRRSLPNLQASIDARSDARNGSNSVGGLGSLPRDGRLAAPSANATPMIAVIAAAAAAAVKATAAAASAAAAAAAAAATTAAAAAAVEPTTTAAPTTTTTTTTTMSTTPPTTTTLPPQPVTGAAAVATEQQVEALQQPADARQPAAVDTGRTTTTPRLKISISPRSRNAQRGNNNNNNNNYNYKNNNNAPTGTATTTTTQFTFGGWSHHGATVAPSNFTQCVLLLRLSFLNPTQQQPPPPPPPQQQQLLKRPCVRPGHYLDCMRVRVLLSVLRTIAHLVKSISAAATTTTTTTKP
jgi:hypothetical protein